jgi:hypothetical protein
MKKILASTLLLTCSLLLANETTQSEQAKLVRKQVEPIMAKPSIGQIEQSSKDKVIADQLKNSQLTEEDKQKMFQDFLNKKVLNVFAAQHNIPLNTLSVSSTDFDAKNNLTSYIIDVKDNEVKGLIFMTQDGAFLLGDFITSDGKNLFKETFMNINKDFFDKQNMEKNLEKDKIKTKRVKFIKDLDLSNKSSYIYIWGHSLDKSDKDYVDEIFEFLLDKNLSSSYERKLFIIYHDVISKSNMLLNLLSIRGKKDVEHCMRSNKLEFIKSDYQNLNEYFNKHEKAPISMNPGFY